MPANGAIRRPGVAFMASKVKAARQNCDLCGIPVLEDDARREHC